MSIKDIDVAIVGGGISGLSLALSLDMLGISYIILEKADKLGGSAITFHKHDCCLDMGPNVIRYTESARHLFDYIGAESCIKDIECNNIRYVYVDDKFYQLPMSLRDALKSPILDFKFKLKLFMDYFYLNNPVIDANISIYQFAKNKFGDAFANNIIKPMINGIFACDANEISFQNAFGHLIKVLEMNKGSAIRSYINFSKNKKNEAKLITFQGGIESLINHMIKKIQDKSQVNKQDNILSSTYINKIEYLDSNDYLISCHLNNSNNSNNSKSLQIKSKIIAFTSTREGFLESIESIKNYKTKIHNFENLRKMHFSSLGIAKLIYKKENILNILQDQKINSIGFLTDMPSLKPLLGALFTSSMNCSSVAKDLKMFTLFFQPKNNIIGEHSNALNDSFNDSLNKAVEHFSNIMKISSDNIMDIEHTIWKNAIPIIDNNYSMVKNEFLDFENDYRGIFFNTNYYPSGNGVIKSIDKSNILAKQIQKYINNIQHN